jgi:hypothetical protein
MQNVVTIGREYVPIENIVLVEPFVPRSDSGVKSQRDLKGRVVRRIGRPLLTEMTPQEFAQAHGFRMLSEDNVAVNPDPAMEFSVESFAPTETFKPTKPYLTRLKWSGPGPDDNDRSKLLLAKP